MECRINAENPENFAPSPGRITGLNLPGGIGVRVDTAAYQDCVIPPYYDSLVAKLITHGRDRAEAISRMNRALGMFVVEGIHTSIPMQQRILADPDFAAGAFDTNFVKRFMPAERQGVKAKALDLAEDPRAVTEYQLFQSNLDSVREMRDQERPSQTMFPDRPIMFGG